MITQESDSGSWRSSALERIDWRVVLLACAVASAPLYLAMDVASSLLYDGYSYKDQTISELSAIGAPTRTLWVVLGTVYAGLLVAGAVGIWLSAGEKVELKIIAVLVGIVGAMGFVAWPFAAMHQREVLAAGGGTTSDTLHLALGGVNSIIFIVMLALGARALGGRFRMYTLGFIVVFLVFGLLMAMETPDVGDDQPTPWLGIWERIVVEGAMVWISVLALVLLRRTEITPTEDGPSPPPALSA
jgi:hypothetical protein